MTIKDFDSSSVWIKGINSNHLDYSIAKFMRTAETQEKKGIEKYGKPLDPLDLKYDWLQMAEEEQVDGYKYLVAEQKKRQFIAEKIRNILHSKFSETSDVYLEIKFWLDALEGR